MATRSLGTLTLDLIARIGGFTAGMDKASRESEKWRKEVEKNAKAAGAAIGAAAAAGITALTAMTVATVNNAGELSRFAAISGTTEETFQRYAAGAKLAGVEQEKLADIFKDVNDKVGEFMQTGGGQLKDFFENIAPKVGVTAEQFRKLSGPQALELYVSSLEKAGTSQPEMTFYLEALADETTALLPLLKNNAQGFREVGEAAAQAGAILDQDTIRAANELAAAAFLSEQAFVGMKNQIMSALLPTLADLADELFDVSADTTVASEAGETLAGILKGLAAAAFGTYAAFQLVGKSIAAMAAALSAAGVEGSDLLLGPLSGPVIGTKIAKNLDAFKSAWSVGFDDVHQTMERDFKVLNDILNAGNEGGPSGRVKGLADMLAELKKNSGAAASGLGSLAGANDQAAKAAASAMKAIDSQVASLQLQAATLGMSEKESTLFKLALDGATKAQLNSARAALEQVDAYNAQQEAMKENEELMKQVREIQVSTWSDASKALQEYQEQVEKLREALLKGKISQEEYDRTVEGLDEKWKKTGDEGTKQAGNVEEAWNQAARSMQSSLSDFLFDPFEGGLKGMVKSFGTVLQRMVADVVAADLMGRMFGSMLPGGTGEGWISQAGNFLSSFFGGGRANGGPVSAGMLYEVGEFNRPEVLHMGGKQYMIPGNNGNVSPMRGGGGSIVNNISLPGVTNAREAREASASIQRAIARGVSSAARYA
ncbi:hypothetical protein D9M70_310360 [compost metagenome]